MTSNQSLLSQGNQALREGKYADAIEHYILALQQTPALEKTITANLTLARQKQGDVKQNFGEARPSAGLEKIGSSLSTNLGKQSSCTKKIAVVVHYFYPEIWIEIKKKLVTLPQIFDLFVTVPIEKAESATKDVLPTFPSARICVGPNIGMDIIPFLSLVPVLSNEGYFTVCKIQTKKGDGNLAVIWRDLMLESLIGSGQNFTRAIDAFINDEKLCMIGPAALYQSGQHLMYDNANNLSNILNDTYSANLPEADWGFFAGTMFWARVDVLLRLAKHANFGHLALDGEYKKDGKFEHALERCLGLLPRMHDGKVGLLQPKKGLHDDCEVMIFDSFISIGQAHIGDVMRQIARIDNDRKLINQSGYFDDAYYLGQNPELVGSSVDLVYHYLTQGTHCGKSPCSGFSTYQEITAFFKEKGDERNPLLFYIEHGAKNHEISEYIKNNSYKRSSIFDKDLIRSTGLFDAENYLRQYPELRKTGDDSLDHYLREGTFNELYPNQYFIPREYRALHNDVVQVGIEPFYHYLTAGAIEGRCYRSTKWREEEESPFFRYMVLNSVLINWAEIENKKNIDDLISIIIPIYGQAKLTRDCLDSILAAKTKANFEVVCVDNGSGVEIKDLLTEFSRRDKRIRHLINKENYNFGLGCNLGFREAHGSIVVFLNNDTTVTDNWLDELIKPLADSRVAAVQPKLLYPDNTIQNVGIVFAPKQTLGYPIYADFRADTPCTNVSRDFQAVTGACLAIKSSDFARLRGFDPLFINGQEDVDLCLRLTYGTGRSCHYQPTSVVIHHESKTPGRGKYITLNRKNFTDRWRNKLESDDYKYYADDKFRIVRWNKDNEGLVKLGIGISRPVLEKIKTSPLHFFWNKEQENRIKNLIDIIYTDKQQHYQSVLVSVIMPTYNRASIIKKAIDSVIQQSHKNFELLICDDGSTDNTKEIVAQYLSDSRVRFFQLNHVGVSGARNKGLEMARGEIIAYLDSDNTWDRDFIKTMLVFMDHGKLDAAYSSIHAVDDQVKTICYRGDNFDWEECLKENYIDMNAFVHTRKQSMSLRFDENLKRLVDWDFILRITKDTRVSHIPYLGVTYYDGDQYQRITRTEYQGNEISGMQELIRNKHLNNQGTFAKSNNPELMAEILLNLKHRGHDQAISSSVLVLPRNKPLSFRIKIGCPNLSESHEWGDYHFANAMKRSLEKLNHLCEVDCLDRWESPEAEKADVIIVLRGLSRYKPKKGQINLMWNISHPDKIGLDEYAEYDHVFVASSAYAKKLQKKVAVPVSSLLQCTDPALFNPSVPKKEHHKILFVGNSRNVYRRIVKDAVQAELPISVFGTRWEQFISKEYIVGEHINNEELAGFYASAGIVLNDHWDTMQDYGFLSNRLFDATACAALVVTDDIEGLRDVFGDTVLTYTSPAHLQEICSTHSLQVSMSQRIELAKLMCAEHSFDARIKLILSVTSSLLTSKGLIHG